MTDPEPESHLILDPLDSFCDFKLFINGHVLSIFAEEIHKEEKQEEGRCSGEQGGEDQTGVVSCEIVEDQQNPLSVKRPGQSEPSVEMGCDLEEDSAAEVKDKEAEDRVASNEALLLG